MTYQPVSSALRGLDGVIGGDGYASHEDCDPIDAVGDLSGADGSACWICGEPIE